MQLYKIKKRAIDNRPYDFERRKEYAGRLRESEINFVFCEWELYVGTAPEQKTESAKSGLNITFKPLFYKCIFDFISARASPCPTSLLYDNLSTARFSHFIDSLRRTLFAFFYTHNSLWFKNQCVIAVVPFMNRL